MNSNAEFSVGHSVIYIKDSNSRYEFSVEANLVLLRGGKAIVSYRDGGGRYRKLSIPEDELAKTYGCNGNGKGFCVGQTAVCGQEQLVILLREIIIISMILEERLKSSVKL